MLTSLIDHSRHETTKGFKAKSYPGGAFGGNSPLLGIEEDGCDIRTGTWGSDGASSHPSCRIHRRNVVKCVASIRPRLSLSFHP